MQIQQGYFRPTLPHEELFPMPVKSKEGSPKGKWKFYDINGKLILEEYFFDLIVYLIIKSNHSH